MLDPIKNLNISKAPSGETIEAVNRQRRDLNKRKDFKKILEDNDEDTVGADEEKVGRNKGKEHSIFDLSSDHDKQATAGLPPPQVPLDLAAAAGKKGSDEKQDLPRRRIGEQVEQELGDSHPDSSSYLAVPKAFDIQAHAAEEANPDTAPTMKQIVDQIVAKLYTLRTNGQTETVMALKNPPQLVGAEVVLTSFDHARGEFNIAIHNLTQAAQNFLEQNNIRIGLKAALEEHGYAVHMLTTTTEPFRTAPVEIAQEESRSRQGRDREQQPDQGREQKQG